MTPQTLVQVDFSEINSVDITCKHCGASIRLPLPRKTLDKNVVCMGCNAFLWNGEGDEAYHAIQGLLRTVSVYKEHAEKLKYSVGFSLVSTPS